MTFREGVFIAFVTNGLWTGKAWIGLYDDAVNGWRWSLNISSFYGSGETEFRNWNVTQPRSFNDQQSCVALFTGSPYFGTWGDVNCTTQYPFICYSGEFCCRSSDIFSMNSTFEVSLLFRWCWNKNQLWELTHHQCLSRFRRWSSILCQNKSQFKLVWCSEILQEQLCWSSKVQHTLYF